jgi:VanZ family protein
LDKVAHTGLYMILGATLGYGRHHAIRSPPHWVLVGLGALYGATDEWHQGSVRGRYPDWVDWLADVTGVTVGYVALLLGLAWLARRKALGEKRGDVAH